MIDAEIQAEVDALIEQNPTDLEARLEKLILGDIRKKLDNTIGKIAKNKGEHIKPKRHDSMIYGRNA